MMQSAARALPSVSLQIAFKMRLFIQTCSVVVVTSAVFCACHFSDIRQFDGRFTVRLIQLDSYVLFVLCRLQILHLVLYIFIYVFNHREPSEI